MNEIILTENDLNLVVTEKTLGNLKTNALQIKELVKNSIPKYDVVNYNESNIDQAKKDKALLNNAAKSLNAKRIEIEKEWMRPFTEFKTIVADTVSLISECSSKIDSVVKQNEEKERAQKKLEIQKYYLSKNFELVDLDKIFEQKWLNKTEKLKSIQLAIDEQISKIKDDLKTLESIGEDVELLKALYLDTLNINTTIQYANTLRANKERAKEAEKATIATSVPQQDFPQERPIQEPAEQSKQLGNQAELLTRAFRVTTSRENIIALGNYMTANGISFEKIELHEKA